MTSHMADGHSSGSTAAGDWDGAVRPSVSEYLTRQVMELARRQRLQPGDRLPSVQALASRFSVAAPTMRESLRRLQAVGVLDIRHGSGVYLKRAVHRVVLPNPHPGPLSRSVILDLLEARLLIEPHLALRAAQRVTGEDASHLRRTLQEAGEHLRDEDQILGRLNMTFHREIAHLSSSAVLAQVIDSLVDVYEDEQLVVMQLYGDRERDHQWHLTICEAICDHDASRAEQLMHEHLAGVRDVLAARLAEDGSAGDTGRQRPPSRPREEDSKGRSKKRA
jgi:GntR family transcriptional regulator, transcriptional repressor for pyruvate dehydrogenase complex